jgi:hypothetical protein
VGGGGGAEDVCGVDGEAAEVKEVEEDTEAEDVGREGVAGGERKRER